MEGFKKIILILSLVAFLILIVGSFVFAQRPLEVGYPEAGGISPETTSIGLPDYIKYIFNFSLGLAGLIAFGVLVYGGIRYLTSAGNPSAMGDAKNQIFAAFLGLAVLLGSYLILTTINPQLVFLGIPERVVFQKEPIIELTPEEKETLFYTEIPTGGLIEELFLEERLENIKNVAQETKEKAEGVKNLSEELKALTDKCECSNCYTGWCDPGGCAGRCGCISHCECSNPYGDYDPCGTYRGAIYQKRMELKESLSESEGLIKYWQKKLEVEINGSPAEGEKEKYIGFRQVYEDLKSAEDLIKNCPLSSSKKGYNQILLTYHDFWQYREWLEGNEKIKGAKPEYPFDYIPPETPYYLATFYCAELFLPEVPKVDVGEIERVPIERIEAVEGKKTFCSSEIAIGETVDNAEELARRMLVELDNINNNVLNEIEAAESLSNINVPEECKCKNCNSHMLTSYSCCECCPPPEGEGEGEEGGGTFLKDWFNFLTLKPFFIYAAGGCEWGCCGTSCCTGCRCVCGGSPCPSHTTISNLVTQIENNYSEIDKSNTNLKNLIEGEEVEDKLKISEIFKNLDFAQNQLGLCYKTAEKQAKLGKEKVLWPSLYSCSQLLKYGRISIPFYDEKGQRITECYGAEREAELFDNFFCCEPELF